MNVPYAYSLQDDASRDLAYLKDRGVENFVHFTAASNLESILTNGILPRSLLEERGMEHVHTDDYRGEGTHVINLSITNPNIKMFYAKRKSMSEVTFVVLTLDPSLLLNREGSYEFRATNAASYGSQRCSVEEVFAGDRPDFFESSWPTDNQAEVLFNGRIDPAYIKSIQFRGADQGNEAVADLEYRIASLARELRLHCSVGFSDKYFEYDKRFLGECTPREQYELYFESWAADEKAAAASAEAIRLIERQKTFDSTAYASEVVSRAQVEPNKDVVPSVVWDMRYRAPFERMERSNAQLSAFSVIEKIVNRGRKTRLSAELEGQMRNADEIALAHQMQCVLVELLKQQSIGRGCLMGVARSSVWKSARTRIGMVFRYALVDLQKLSAHVCSLYGCEDLMAGIGVAKDLDGADIILNLSDKSCSLAESEVRISSARPGRVSLPFDFTRVTEPVPIHFDLVALRFILHYVFRFDDFREGQVEAIRRGLRRQDTIVLLPTGSGKSIVFQLLSLVTPGIAFVVCPIISLIEDQITNLRQRGIDRVTGLSSAMDSNDRGTVLQGLTSGQYLICYVAPERFQNRRFNASVRRYAATNLISTIAVDEAHCVSEWGHEFRTAYLGLSRTCRDVCSTEGVAPPILALTGTASTSVLTDMMNDLDIRDEYAVIQPRSFDRPEIHYRVIRVPSDRKLSALSTVVDEMVPHDFNADASTFYLPNGDESNCGIVFCVHANGSYGLLATERQLAFGHPGVWDFMDGKLPGLCSYYSGSAPKRLYTTEVKWNVEKRAQASRFKGNETTVMVATKAFGMGIDKPNVRWVVHFGMPGSLESYYQEVGRAARDRQIAYAYLILSDDYHSLNEELLDPSRTPITELESRDKAFKGKWDGDDVSRAVFFHSNTFGGVDAELEAAVGVLRKCGRDNWWDGQWHVEFENGEKESMERAIYRFTLLGVYEGYAIDYSPLGGTFVIKPCAMRAGELRDHIVERYLEHIAAYQPDEAYLRAAERNLQDALRGAKDDRDFILRAMRHLLGSFVYKVLEEGRRRATKTMLDAANSAADAGGGDATDRELRRQMLAYLQTDSQRGGRGVLSALLTDATNMELIMGAIRGGNGPELLGQTSRLLEDYPEHYGLHFIQAAIYALNGDVKRFGPSLRAMVAYGTRSYGLGKNVCEANFLKFMNDPVAKGITAESIDRLLPDMCQCFGCTEDRMLTRLKSAQARMLRSVDALYKLATEAERGLQWIRAK